MITLIVQCQSFVRFFVTKYPDYRFQQLKEEMPVDIVLLGTTTRKAKDIKLQFANNHHHGQWYTFDNNLQDFLQGILK